MTNAQPALPKWILIVSGLIALMEVMVSISLCVSPGSVLETVDLTAKGVMYVVYMWAARQFALGVIFAYATYMRSVPMLTIAYIFFLVMFIGDLIIGLIQKENGMMLAAVVMILISVGMLSALYKRK